MEANVGYTKLGSQVQSPHTLYKVCRPHLNSYKWCSTDSEQGAYALRKTSVKVSINRLLLLG